VSLFGQQTAVALATGLIDGTDKLKLKGESHGIIPSSSHAIENDQHAI
jgi:hypothetical protein